MQWQDQAIILSLRKFAEYDAVVTLFSREYGLYSGVAKAAFSSRQRGIYQAGNVVSAHWNARLAEHVGTLKSDLEIAHAAMIMQDRLLLCALNALCALVPLAVHERDPHPPLYDALAVLLGDMVGSQRWQEAYVRFELLLLQEAGYGLSLDRCVATGGRESLHYVSPKSGGAVCEEAAAPYRDKLLAFPAFLINQEVQATQQEIRQGLALTGHFLESWLLAAIGKPMPQARSTFVESFIKVSQTPSIEWV